MKVARVKLESVSPMAQGRPYEAPKKDRELPKDYEARTWRQRMHINEAGNVFIPPSALKNSLSEAAKYSSLQIPGKGKATYTKNFEAGVLVAEPADLGIKADSVDGQWLFVPASGRRGDGKRVWKCFPVIPHWSAEAEYLIFDEIITEDVFKEILISAGQFIGLGSLRVRNNGWFGRFAVKSIEWS